MCDTSIYSRGMNYVILAFPIVGLVAMYHMTRLRFRCRFESCDVNGPESVTKILRNKGQLLPLHFSLLVVRNRSRKCLNESNFTLRFV